MDILSSFFEVKFDATHGGLQLGTVSLMNTEQLTLLLSKAAKILFTLIAMFIIVKVGNIIINKTVEKQKELKFSIDIKKAKTLAAVLKSILKYAVYFLGIVYILTVVFDTISLTFAGIGGVAIGFGAQNLIKDIINGFFILFEDQYSVGDSISIEGKNGIVESVELRITKLRDFNGDVHIIPNGLIQKVTNHSKGDLSISVFIDVLNSENIERTFDVLKDVCKSYSEENSKVKEGPNVLGIISLKENAYTVKISGKVVHGFEFELENLLRLKVKQALDKANIKTFYPIIHMEEINNGKNF